MDYIPEELFSRILEALDETSLVVLSCVSRRCRARIACRQAWWRKRFERHFLYEDEHELKWLQHQMRVHVIKAYVRSISSGRTNAQRDTRLDWFTAYCMRRATEYRWRHGQCTRHQLTNVAITRPRGIRLQSMLLSPNGSPAKNAVIVSQWLFPPQKQPTWLLEQPCWGDTAMEHINIRDSWSGEYTIIRGTHIRKDDSHADLHSLYVWHSAAFHKPPRVIVAGQFVMNISVFKNWVVCQYLASETARRYTTHIYNLASNLYCSESLAPVTSCRILSATQESVHIIQLHYSELDIDSALATCVLWDVTPSHAAPFKWKAARKKEVFKTKQSPVRSDRVDDNRFLLWTDCEEGDDEVYAEIAPGGISSLVLLQVVNDVTGASLEEKWSNSIRAAKVWPIVSRNLLLVDYKDTSDVLLSLEDGSVIHRVSLPCWYYSHLYPLEAQWRGMTKHATWKDPRRGLSRDCRTKTLPNAMIYGRDAAFSVFDYADYIRRPYQKTQLALEQQLASFIDVTNLSADKRHMLFRVFV